MVSYMSREVFLEEYDYAVEKDFSVGDVPASWAHGNEKLAHRFWGDEDHKIQVPRPDDGRGMSAVLAVSSDGQLLAAACSNLITIYHIPSRARRTQLRAPADDCRRLFFNLFHLDQEKEGYQLVSELSRARGEEAEILIWTLDQAGCQIDAVKPVNASELAKQSLDAIVPALNTDYGLTQTSPLLQQVRDGYTRALEKLSSALETQDLKAVNGQLSSYIHTPFSADGQLMLYLEHNRSTQGGSRPASELPHVVIHDLGKQTRKHALGGHEDAIMWAAFSPDQKTVASASWDQFFRLWDVASGECTHVIGPTGGQNWSGAWSPDSKHVLLSGMSRKGPSVAVYSRDTGEEVERFEHEQLKGWARPLDWSVKGDIAIGNGANVWIWKPFERKISSHFRLNTDRQPRMKSFADVTDVRWVGDGRYLAVATGDGTLEVWDSEDNVKWRLQRPKGTPMSTHGSGIYWVDGSKTLIHLDGDCCVRFYEL